MTKKEEMQQLVTKLNAAAKAYYQDGAEIMTNFEYDKLYDALEQLEQETGVVLANSPTVRVGYEVLSQLPKEQHPSPMLSLDKTKDREQLAEFLGNQPGLLSWKLDGLTVVLTYDNGELVKAVTRGNGLIGEVITNNAKTFVNLPLHIQYTGHLVLRGEAVIAYSDFIKINDSIQDAEGKYKNPRNLCAGTVRQLNNEITAKRKVRFYAFALIEAEGVDFGNSIDWQFQWLSEQGFDVVEHCLVSSQNVVDAVAYFEQAIGTFDIPSDGLVLVYDDIAYGNSLGQTAKFPRNGIAFKWKDETAQTVLRDIEWSPSRTGLINPVAVFDPVELEGTTVSRASVHNVSIVEALQLGVGDEILVYKANMIIPQIGENLTRSSNLMIPAHCPACGGDTQIADENGTKTLICTNPECSAKHVKSFTLLVSRDALNIDGLSEETLRKFIAHGFLKERKDIFELDTHREEIVAMEGLGEKSYEKLAASIAKARHTELYRVVYGMGIPNVGLSNAKLICKALNQEPKAVMSVTAEELTTMDGIGDVIANQYVAFFENPNNRLQYEKLLEKLELEAPTEDGKEQVLAGKVFVITGSVEQFANRSAMKEFIEGLGGKVTGSVTGKTNYLINNDATSNSTKNKKAKELGVEILTEAQFMEMVQ